MTSDQIAQQVRETPPQHLIDLAIEVSGWSPCRSKRGVVIFSGDDVLSHGHNHKPDGFRCDGSAACKATCRDQAIHAEQFALLVGGGRNVRGAEMLHVKTVDGRLVPSGGPSCVQCSKLLLAAGISAMWLYRESGWVKYDAVEFHRLSLAALVPLLTPDGEIEKLKAQNGVLKQRWRTLLALQMQAKSIEEIDGDPVIADMRSVEIQHPILGESKPLPAGSRSAETIMQPLIDAVDRLLDVDGRGGAPEEIAHAIGDVSTARAIAETRAENQLQCELASLISAYETLRQAAQQLDTALTDEFRNTERPHGLADDPSHDDHIDSAWRALRQLLTPRTLP